MRRERTRVFVNQSNLVIRQLSDINDIDLTQIEDGTVLVYNEQSEKWVATKNLDNQNIGGGLF